MNSHPMKVHLLVSHIPIDMYHFIINFGVMLKKDPNASEAENKAALEAYNQKNLESFHQDVAIWNNKCIIDNPLMCDGDGPIHLVRKWYSQFMTDIDNVSEDQVRAREQVTMEGPSVEETMAQMNARRHSPRRAFTQGGFIGTARTLLIDPLLLRPGALFILNHLHIEPDR